VVESGEVALLGERNVGRVETVLADGVGGSLVEETGQTVLRSEETGGTNGEGSGGGEVETGGNPGSGLHMGKTS
jgi:hypothetical protein